jgi:hypothetical protein
MATDTSLHRMRKTRTVYSKFFEPKRLTPLCTHVTLSVRTSMRGYIYLFNFFYAHFSISVSLSSKWRFQKIRVRHLYTYYRTYSIQWWCRKNHKKYSFRRKKFSKLPLSPLYRAVTHVFEWINFSVGFDLQNARLPHLKKYDILLKA